VLVATRAKPVTECDPVPMRRRSSVAAADVRAVAAGLPRSYEVVVHGRLKFRVGQIVWLSFSHDQTVMGFSFPKELRQALVDSDPDTFSLPSASDMRFNWVHVRLDAINMEEMQELVVDAWSTVVPKFVVAEYVAANPGG
jgi:hypothetical protein